MMCTENNNQVATKTKSFPRDRSLPNHISADKYSLRNLVFIGKTATSEIPFNVTIDGFEYALMQYHDSYATPIY